ncbi:MAM and LDL-receptor class A domain-containing protein 1 [Diplonema papillatum]|nr:MAM and LDL-receptor class A domain-containing protein 1 [Diplonema papillatum]
MLIRAFLVAGALAALGSALNTEGPTGRPFVLVDDIQVPVDDLHRHETPLGCLTFTGKEKMWPEGKLRYAIATDYTHEGYEAPYLSDNDERIAWAVSHIQAKTCIRFSKCASPYTCAQPFVLFISSSFFCSSPLGMQGGINQITATNCDQGGLAHEILHTLGIMHEQSRNDRDDYVFVNESNITPGLAYNFAKSGASGRDMGAYDYGSIMHYRSDALTVDPAYPSIVAPVPIGQLTGLSRGDIDTIDFLYNGCSEVYEAPICITSKSQAIVHTMLRKDEFVIEFDAECVRGGTMRVDYSINPYRVRESVSFTTSVAEGQNVSDSAKVMLVFHPPPTHIHTEYTLSATFTANTPSAPSTTCSVRVKVESDNGCAGGMAVGVDLENFEVSPSMLDGNAEWVYGPDPMPERPYPWIGGPTSGWEGARYLRVPDQYAGGRSVWMDSLCYNLRQATTVVYSVDIYTFGEYAETGVFTLGISKDETATFTTLWNSSGKQPEVWHRLEFDLAEYIGYGVVMRLDRASLMQAGVDVARMAIDYCTDGLAGSHEESFEAGFGLWEHSYVSAVHWSRNSGPTPTAGTGPLAAYDGAGYIYVESSGNGTGFPRKSAYLISPCYYLQGKAGAQAAFSFAYHMHSAAAADVGSFSVEISENSGLVWRPLWVRSESQADAWQVVSIDMTAYLRVGLQLRFNRVTGSEGLADVAVDRVKMLVQSCDEPEPIPYTESFESGIGRWTQDQSDDIDWTRLSGPTPSTNTGPSYASDGLSYMYVEASGANYPYKSALLTSPCFNLPDVGIVVLTFDYHMYGITTAVELDYGPLALELSGDGGVSWSEVWAKEANQGNGWTHALVSLEGRSGDVRFRFSRVTGSYWSTDAAVDAFRLTPDPCPGGLAGPFSESFEAGFGGWTQSPANDVDWTRYSGGTPSTSTGPSAAAAGFTYVYVEASGTGSPSKRAILNSPCVNLHQAISATFSFSYHMYGQAAEFGQFALEVTANGGASWGVLWSEAAMKGNVWLVAEVDLAAYLGLDVQLRFNRVTGNGWQTDVAVDDVKMAVFYYTAAESIVASHSESFEDEHTVTNLPKEPFSVWTQTTADDLEWTKRSGPTPTVGTGPAAAYNHAYYAYVEASGAGVGYPRKRAVLTGPRYSLREAKSAVFSFAFHLHAATEGAGVGSLTLEVSGSGGVEWEAVWSADQNQGNGWVPVSVGLADFVGWDLRLRFVRLTGEHEVADAAIDALQLTVSFCPGGFAGSREESFEAGFGLWGQNDDGGDHIDWLRKDRQTHSALTGPTNAFDGEYFVYVESSMVNTPAKRAILNSPCYDLRAAKTAEFSFAYEMHGRGIFGTYGLEISTNDGASWASLWSISTSQGDMWHTKVIDLASYLGSVIRLRFNRVTGAAGDYETDACLDMVKLTVT